MFVRELSFCHKSNFLIPISLQTEAELKEFETRLKYGWFRLNLYPMFQDLSQRLSIETGFWWI